MPRKIKPGSLEFKIRRDQSNLNILFTVSFSSEEAPVQAERASKQAGERIRENKKGGALHVFVLETPATQANSGEKNSYRVVSVEQLSVGLPLVTIASMTDSLFRGKIRDQLISQSKDAAQVSDEVTSSS